MIGPQVEIEKVRHGPVAQPIQRVAKGPANQQPKGYCGQAVLYPPKPNKECPHN